MRDTVTVGQVSAKARARRRVSKHPQRRAVDQRVARGLDGALEEVRAEIADDARRDPNEPGDAGTADDAELSQPQVRYLAALRVKPSVGCGMRLAGVRFANLKRWRESARFRELEAEAVELGKGVLFEVVWNAAVIGVLEPVYQGGLLVGHRRKFSDRMRELLAKALMPELFDRGALAGKPARPTIVLGTAQQVAAVVRKYSPTSRRSVDEQHPHPNDAGGNVA